MASLTRDNAGRARIQFYNDAGERKTIRLGAVPEKTASEFLGWVEALIVAQSANARWDRALAAWVQDLPDRMHKRLANVGLVAHRQKAAVMTLGDLLTRFENTASVKPATMAAYRQAMNSLREQFSAARPLATLTPADADAWRRAQADSGLAAATVAKRTHVSKAIFRRAVKWGLLRSNPFAELRAGSQSNPDRSHYVKRETINAVLGACPDNEWRGIVALSRFAALRVPSEIVLLRWGDVNWERGRLMVRSPKTAGHDGHAVRVVPIAPELKEILLALFDEAEPGDEAVIPRLRNPGTNLRTQFHKIIRRAGEVPWPRLYHNLRASCISEWAELAPAHAVAKWAGHSPLISATHYLMTDDSHFEAVSGGVGGAAEKSGAKSGAIGARKQAPQRIATNCTESENSPEVVEIAGVTQVDATQCNTRTNPEVGAAGFEPA